MATINAYADGHLPRLGDFVRAVMPDGPVHGLTVVGSDADTVTAVEDVSNTAVRLPARQLSLISRPVSYLVALKQRDGALERSAA